MNSVFVSFSADPAMPLIWRGLTLEPGEVMLHSRGERLHQRTVAASCWGLISLPPAALAAFGKTLTGSTLAAPKRGKILRPCVRDQKRLVRIHAEAARLAETNPRTLSHPEVVRAMEQELVVVLITCLTNSEERAETATMQRAAHIMSHFEQMLANTPHQSWSLAELRTSAGVSDRTFRKYFATFVGATPNQYMRLRRLQLVRSAILRSNGEVARIGDLARAGGFTETGRFAVLYRCTFGETPSATRRRTVG
jgi:AraC-like DNA-binding protein